MSFPYIEDLENSNGIYFPEKEGPNMNILIGANGSGKSNFIEIINQFIKNLVLDYTFDKNILIEQKTTEYKNAIHFIPKKTSKLSKHSKSQNLPANIEISFELFENDFENI